MTVKKAYVLSLLLVCKISLASPAQTDSLIVNGSHGEISDLIYKQAVDCWTRDYNFFKGDAFIVERRSLSKITVRRDAHDISLQRPFMIVSVIQEDLEGKSVAINVSEGKCASGCNMNFTPDVRRWLSGDLTCSRKLYRKNK